MTTLIQIENLHKSFGTRTLFEDAAAVFSAEQKIGVIGRNGAGKSTLCRIITGEETPDSGTVTLTSACRLSYLRQDDPYRLDETVIGFLARSSGRPEWECAKTAGRFHIKGERLNATIETLPGGYRTRVKLTAMLLTEPNFLVLDEPTNYLDLSTLILLEDFLAEYTGGFLVVSHDREFLKRTCEETLEIEDGEMTLYPGTVEEYLEYKEEQREQAIQHNRKIETKRKQLERFVERFRAKASKATQAQSKMKQIARLKTIEIAHPMSNVRIRIPKVEPKKGIAFECRDLAIGYPTKLVASSVGIEIDRGAHVAVLGDNGQGKTTFLRTIAGDLEPKAGTFRWGHNVSVGYYAQHVFSALEPEQTVLESLTARAADGITRQEILDLAGSFLFKGEDVRKRIKVLSGGECARVLLAGLMLTRCSVLLLDEPTNHLDFETVEILGNSLKDFQGTLFFISHDRTFVNQLATRILDVKDGSIISYPGTYEEYVYRLSSEMHEEDEEPEAKAEPVKESNAFEARKELRSRIEKSKKEMNRLNEQMIAHRKEKEEIEYTFAKKPQGWTKTANKRLDELKGLIEAAEGRWLELSVEQDELKMRMLKN